MSEFVYKEVNGYKILFSKKIMYYISMFKIKKEKEKIKKNFYLHIRDSKKVFRFIF